MLALQDRSRRRRADQLEGPVVRNGYFLPSQNHDMVALGALCYNETALYFARNRCYCIVGAREEN
jgi:hypothetical protein